MCFLCLGSVYGRKRWRRRVGQFQESDSDKRFVWAVRYVAEPEMLEQLMEEDDWIGGRLCTVAQDDNGRNIIRPK